MNPVESKRHLKGEYKKHVKRGGTQNGTTRKKRKEKRCKKSKGECGKASGGHYRGLGERKKKIEAGVRKETTVGLGKDQRYRLKARKPIKSQDHGDRVKGGIPGRGGRSE